MKVIVIGGGLAGLAAGIRLQEARHDVVVLERRGVLGGRSTSSRDAVTGDAVDNGAHLMLGAYHATLDLVRRAGAQDLLEQQETLRIDYVDSGGRARLSCPPVGAPLHLAFGLLGLRLPWRARWQALRLGLALGWGRERRGTTLAEYFARHGQGAAVRRLLWDPLATAILNVAPEVGDAGLFVTCLRRAFFASARDSALVFVRAGLGDLADRLGVYLESRGGVVRRHSQVEAIDVCEGRAVGVSVGGEAMAADAVVCAVPWNRVAALVPAAWREQTPFVGLERLGVSPIASVDLWLDRVVVDREMVGLRESDMEWVFDKGRLCGRTGAPQHLSFVLSAAQRLSPRPNAQLVAAAVEALGRYFPAMAGARVERALVRREPEATFACTPEHEALRPEAVTPIAGLFLAGDWTNTGLPATIEGAVASGYAAARVITESRQTGTP